MSISTNLTRRSDNVAEIAVVELLSNLFDGVAYLDIEVVKRNIELSCAGNSDSYDRTISKKRANFVLKHMGVIYLSLLLNEEFRDTLTEGVSIELAFDKIPKEEVEEYRKALLKKPHDPAEPMFVIDLSKFDDNIYRALNKTLSESFDAVSAYDEGIEEVYDEMTEDAYMKIGFVFSNFFYLIRGLSHNDVFYKWVQDVIKGIEEELAADEAG